MNNQFSMTQKIAISALFAALAYIAFQFLKIPIKLPGAGGSTYFHLGNTFVVLGALMLGGVYGGLAGGIGMAIADITSGEPIYAVTTLFLKLVMGLIAGLVAHKIGHINEKTETKQYMIWCTAAAVVSLGANIVLDPLVGFFRNKYLFASGCAPDGYCGKIDCRRDVCECSAVGDRRVYSVSGAASGASEGRSFA